MEILLSLTKSNCGEEAQEVRGSGSGLRMGQDGQALPGNTVCTKNRLSHSLSSLHHLTHILVWQGILIDVIVA